MVNAIKFICIISLVIGVGLVASPSNYVSLFWGLPANQVAWIGLLIIAASIYVLAKKGR